MNSKRNYMKLIGGGIIGNSNYIGTILNGLILNLTPKQLNPFVSPQKKYILVKVIEQPVFWPF